MSTDTPSRVEPFVLPAVLAAEVPAGALAARALRRRLLIVVRLVKSCCFSTWLVLPGLWGYLAGFVYWGVASTLRRGTAESVQHEALRRWGNRAVRVVLWPGVRGESVGRIENREAAELQGATRKWRWRHSAGPRRLCASGYRTSLPK